MTQLVPVDGGTLAVHVSGSGPPMLIMHGGLGPDHSYLRPWMDGLSGVVTTVFYDQRGCGKSSDLPPMTAATNQLWIEDSNHLRASLGHDRVVLFGHSYGGMLAMEYALTYPDHVFGLVLCCTAPAWDFSQERNATVEVEVTAAIEQLARGAVPSDEAFASLWASVQRLYYKRPNQDIIDQMCAQMRFSAQAHNLSERVLEQFSIVDRLADINAPTLILAGRADWATPVHQSYRIKSELPNARLFIFEESGHYPFIEENALFLDVTSRWLSSIFAAAEPAE